jgi:hypothetical protein
MQRHIFEVDTDTGTQEAYFNDIYGELKQMRWNPDIADTGADLEVAVIPREGDTGDGWVAFSQADVLGSDFVKVPRQDVHDAAGAQDTGHAPIFMAGDDIRVKVTPGGAACSGRLFLYTD